MELEVGSVEQLFKSGESIFEYVSVHGLVVENSADVKGKGYGKVRYVQ